MLLTTNEEVLYRMSRYKAALEHIQANIDRWRDVDEEWCNKADVALINGIDDDIFVALKDNWNEFRDFCRS